jgi:hypothetical protein
MITAIAPDCLQAPDRMWPALDRLMPGHVIAYRATGGLFGHRLPAPQPMLLLVILERR